jgi:hypothetical protein
MNPLIKALLQSIFFMSLLSGLVTACVFFFIGPQWFKLAGWFLGTILIQILYGTITNSIRIRNDQFRIAEIMAAEQLADSQQSMIMDCPYCNVHNKTNIRLDRENTFKCVNCNEIVKVLIEVMPIRVTKLSAEPTTEEENAEVGETPRVKSINKEDLKIGQ